MSYQTVKSLKKGLRILELLRESALENRNMSLKEIAERTEILPVTARNLLRTLEECGYVRRASHGVYEEGGAMYRQYRSAGMLRRVREVGEPVVRRLEMEIRESILLASLVHGKRTELIRCQSLNDRLVNPEWGANEDFYAMRTTRVMLAWMSEEQLDYILETRSLPAPEVWPECGENRKGLNRELRKIRVAGGCMDVHKTYMALAAPLLNEAGEIVASMGCYAPLARTDKVRARGIFQMLLEGVAEIREKLFNTPCSTGSD